MSAANRSDASADTDFTELVTRNAAFLFRVAYAVLRNTHDAEDTVQETLLKLYRNAGWRNVRDERGFLARVTWRMAASRRKQRRVQADDVDVASDERGPETLAIDADWNAVVHRLIDALPEELRQPLVLAALEEFDSPAIALIMDLPEGTVRTRIMRARKILKEKLSALMEGRRGK